MKPFKARWFHRVSPLSGIPFYFRKHCMDNTLNPLVTYLPLPPWEKNLNPKSTPRCSGFRASIAGPSVINYRIKTKINSTYIKTSYYEVIRKKICKCVIGHLSSKPKVNSKINWHNNVYTCHHEIIRKNHSKCVIVKLYSKLSLKNNK